jgi:hypothetical protein
MPARPPPTDPLLAAILEEAAGIRPEDVAPDLDDPALLTLVDGAVAPLAAALTPEGMEEARRVATIALATHPDIEATLERVRARQGGSGVRPRRSPEHLVEAAQRQVRRRGAK